MSTTPGATDHRLVAEAAVRIVDLAGQLGRDDVAAGATAVADRVERADTFVVVLGEFKQGKSSLVNALVGLDSQLPACPVDDDTATAAVTLVSHSPQPICELRSASDTSCDTADGWVAIDTTAARTAIVTGSAEQVRLRRPGALLEAGVTIIDTPGVGGLEGGHTRASLAFLPYADAVLFVTDATAELSAAELAWYQAALAACPVTIPVVTKTDLAPAWQRIVELDAGHLARIGAKGTIVATSAAAYATGLTLDDEPLVAESGIPRLRRTLIERVADPARGRAATRAAVELRRLARQLATQVSHEYGALAGDAAAAAQLAAAQARLAHLRGPAAKWQQRLTDAATDISNRATFDLRAAIRALGQSLDGRVEALESAADWDTFSASLQADLVTAVTDVFGAVQHGFEQLRGDLYELVVEELPEPRVGPAVGLAADEIGGWFEVGGGDEPGAATRAMTAIRGAQSGLMMFGFLGQLLPAAAGALLLSSPLTLALGGAFAGKALLDVRKRSLTARRNQLKQAARKLLDDAQFELANRVGELTRNCTRAVRDEIGELLAIALRTATEAAQSAQQASERSAVERTERTEILRRMAGELRRLDADLTAAKAGPR